MGRRTNTCCHGNGWEWDWRGNVNSRSQSGPALQCANRSRADAVSHAHTHTHTLGRVALSWERRQKSKQETAAKQLRDAAIIILRVASFVHLPAYLFVREMQDYNDTGGVIGSTSWGDKSCNFPTEKKIYTAVLCFTQISPNPKWRISNPNAILCGENFPTKRNFSTFKTQGGSKCSPLPQPLSAHFLNVRHSLKSRKIH